MTRLSYSAGYYQSIKEDSAQSAREIAPLILKLFAPKTVVDVGCGTGTWAKAYQDAGARILAIDGLHVRDDQLVIDTGEFERHDLTQPLRLDRRFDLVNCLEVAEHLPGARAKTFVDDLGRLGDIVIFSAAVPGQGGTHHLNERWPSFWISLFSANGFRCLDCIRAAIWDNERVAWWYAQNMFAFVKESRANDFPEAVELSGLAPTDLVHPRAYVKATVPREMSPRMVKEVLRALPHIAGKILRHFGK